MLRQPPAGVVCSPCSSPIPFNEGGLVAAHPLCGAKMGDLVKLAGQNGYRQSLLCVADKRKLNVIVVKPKLNGIGP